MDEEEELEEELRKLDVKEDLGEEDSDVTPTNTPTPPTPPTVIPLPQSSNTSGFFDGEFTRYSLNEDCDTRTDSSLSWGEDEFEGEATRIVTALFDQIDEILYENSLPEGVKFPLLKPSKNKRKNKPKKAKSLPHNRVILDSIPLDQQQLSRLESEDEAYESVSSRMVDIPPPSESLIAECKEWVANFPHLRVSGVGINILRYEHIESQLLADAAVESFSDFEKDSEEVLIMEGDYENKLQYVTLKPEPCKEKKKDKQKGSQSRICSGSTDPDLLKEHVLIRTFDHFWPIVSQIVEPLLTEYAQYVISHSVQCSSLSRGSSTHGDRGLPLLTPRNMQKEPQSLETFPAIRWNTKVVVNSRPSSAANRLPSRVPNAINEEFTSVSPILRQSPYPYDFNKGRSRSAFRVREFSASSQSSLPSLPNLRNFQRPVSSRSGNHHLLTPMPTVEPRPMSTSSYHRIRDKDNFSKLNRATTIEEEVVSKDQDQRVPNATPPWSRHNSDLFLPSINDSRTGNSLHPRDAASRSRSNSFSKPPSPLTRTNKGKMTSGAEPFVSWIVSKVEEQCGTVESLKLIHSAKPIDKTKHFRRLSHH